MTLGDIKTRAARVSGMDPTTATADSNLLTSFANEAVLQFLAQTKVNIAKASLAVTAGSGDYTLDSDILAFTDVWFEPLSGDRDYSLERLDSSEIIEKRNLAGPLDANSRYYAMQGANVIMLYPAPLSSSDKLHILYVAKAASAMSADAHDPSSSVYGSIPVEYHETLAYYVIWKACEMEDHAPSKAGLQYKAEWEEGIAKARMHLNRKAGNRLAPAQLRRRRFQNTPHTPGTDIG